MEIKRKNIVLFSLIAVLTLVSYVNYSYFKTDAQSASNTPINAELVTNPDEDVINEDSPVDDEFFAAYKLQREKERSSLIATLEGIMKNEASDQKAIENANMQLNALIKTQEGELRMENAIKAKGFKDCVIFIHEDYANVVVDANTLTQVQAAAISDIVQKDLKLPLEKITITLKEK